jgi:hypothetical protein
MATLLIIAAGMGARYGGIKQIEPIGPNGEIIADYSVYDALRAGFNRFVFVIREEIEKDFCEVFFERIRKQVNAEYVLQDMSTLPEGRVKPWGTAHAVMAADATVNEPFMVIGADDFFGKSAFADVHEYITANDGEYEYCMSGYILKDTVTEKGYVSRAICKTDGDGFLTDIIETKKISRKDGLIVSEDESGKITVLNPDSVVSMNAWGFKPSFLSEVTKRFEDFIDKNIANLAAAEYFLPDIPGQLIKEGRAAVKVIESHDRWYGFTYKEDKTIVIEGIKRLIGRGEYPAKLWV